MKKLKLRIIKFVYFLILFIGIINLFPQTSYSELTKQDIQEIRQIIREELNLFEKRIDEKFKGIDWRFDQIDKRFEQMQTFMWMLVVIFIGITGVTIGFALWDRRTMIRPFETKVKQIEGNIQDIIIEVDKIKKLIPVLREIAVVDNKVKEALIKFGLL